MIYCLHGQPAEIVPGLWQSGYPVHGDQVARAGFHTLVLCAEELDVRDDEEARQLFPGVKVISAGFDDSDQRDEFVEILKRAHRAAKLVASELRAGRRVLVTCQQGRNRSGLVSALALVYGRGMSGSDAMALVRRARRNALTNQLFAEYLEWKTP